MDIGSLTISLGVDTKGTLAAQVAISQLAKEVSARTAQMNASVDTFNARLTQLAGKLRSLGWLATTVFTAPILMLGKNMMKAASEFEYSLNKIVGLVGIARDQVDEWGAHLLQLGPKVAKTPTELADAFYFVTSAGLRSSYAMEALEWSAKGATAGLGETKIVADLVTSAMNAYGWEILSAQKATDILVATVREGKAEAPALVSAMGMVLPIASEMGVSFDQVGAAMASMTRTGTNASMSAVQLRQILVSLLKPSKQAQDALAKMGTTAEALRNQIREEGLLEGLMTLKTLTEKYGDALMARVFGNVRALTGALDILGANLENNIGIFERMEETTGDAQKALEAVEGSIRKRMNSALAELNGILIRLGDIVAEHLLPIIERWTERFSKLTVWIEGLNATQKKWIVGIGVTLAAIGPLSLAIGVFSYILGTLSLVLKKITPQVVLFTQVLKANPIWLLIMAISTLLPYLVTMIKRKKEAAQAQKELNEAQKGFKMASAFKEEQEQLIQGNDALRERLKILEQLTQSQLENLKVSLQSKKEEDKAFAEINKQYFTANEQAALMLAAKSKMNQLPTLQTMFQGEKLTVAVAIVDALKRTVEWGEALKLVEARLQAIINAQGGEGSPVAQDIFIKMMEQIDIIDNVTEAYKILGLEYDSNKEKSDVYAKALRDLAELGFSVAGKEMKVVQTYLNELGPTLEDSKKKAEEYKKVMEDFVKPFKDFEESLKMIQRLNSLNIEGYDSNVELLRLYEKTLEDIAKNYDKYAGIDTIFGTTMGGVTPVSQAMEFLTTKINALKQTMADTAEAEKWSMFIMQLNNDLSTNAAKQELLGKKFDRVTADINTYGNAITYLLENFDLTDQKVVMLIEDLTRLQQITSEPLKMVGYVKHLEGAFNSMFDGIINGSQNAFEAMSESFKKALRDMAAQMAARAAMWVFLSAISGGTSSLALGAKGLLKGMSMFEYIGAHMAKGGIVPPGYRNDSFPAMLSSDEAVIPLKELPNMVSPQKMEITIKGKIDGKDIQFVLDEVNYLQGRTR